MSVRRARLGAAGIMHGLADMVPARVHELLADLRVGPLTLSALVCCSALSLALLKWMGKQRILKKMERARQRRDEALRKMEKEVQRFKQQVLLLTSVSLARGTAPARTADFCFS